MPSCMGLDSAQIIKGMGLDPRIGFSTTILLLGMGATACPRILVSFSPILLVQSYCGSQ